MENAKLDLFQTVLFEINNGSTETSLLPKHPKIKRTIYGLINTMGKSNTFSENEILSDAATLSWYAFDSFELDDSTDWQSILEGSDQLNLNRLVKTIVLKLEHELPPLINPNTKRMYDPETGGNMYVTIDFESIDAPTYDKEGNQLGLIGDEVTESFFAQEYDYSNSNPFIDWFREHRHEFLTARQNEFIDAMSVDMAKDTDYVEECDFRELTGIDRTNLNNMKRRIYERTMKAWKKDGISRREVYLYGEIAKWNEFIAIGESDDELATQNNRLAEWIRSKSEEDDIDIAYKALVGDYEATKGLVSYLKGEVDILDSRILYTIYDEVENYIANLKAELEAYVPTAPIMSDSESKERNMFKKARYKAFTGPQPCYVYNREGEYIKTIGQEESGTYKIVKLDTYGSKHVVE